jgi:hypothetical protein
VTFAVQIFQRHRVGFFKKNDEGVEIQNPFQNESGENRATSAKSRRKVGDMSGVH